MLVNFLGEIKFNFNSQHGPLGPAILPVRPALRHKVPREAAAPTEVKLLAHLKKRVFNLRVRELLASVHPPPHIAHAKAPHAGQDLVPLPGFQVVAGRRQGGDAVALALGTRRPCPLQVPLEPLLDVARLAHVKRPVGGLQNVHAALQSRTGLILRPPQQEPGAPGAWLAHHKEVATALGLADRVASSALPALPQRVGAARTGAGHKKIAAEIVKVKHAASPFPHAGELFNTRRRMIGSPAERRPRRLERSRMKSQCGRGRSRPHARHHSGP